MMTRYLTLSQAYKQLINLGYTDDLEIVDFGYVENDEGDVYDIDDLKVVEYHKFQGLNNPIELSVIYAVEAPDGRKGTIVDAYGISSNGLSSGLIDRVDRLPQAS